MARLLWPSALLAALLLSAACGVLGAIDEAKAAADLATVCGDSTELTGCSLAAKCEDGSASGDLCAPFPLLAAVCWEASMGANSTTGCELYTEQCVEGEAPECALLASMITSEEAKAAMMEMCYTHYMGACRDCGGDGTPENSGPCEDPLAALAKACLSMPGMSECEGWTGLCSDAAFSKTFPKLCA